VSAACFRCQPRSVPRYHLAASLHAAETPGGCACLVDCGQPGCTGKPQPAIDKPTRAHTMKEGKG
jgi:hypothetical protein